MATHFNCRATVFVCVSCLQEFSRLHPIREIKATNKQRKAGLKFYHVLFSLSRLVATANICNVVLMRNHELFTGIEVKEKDGNVVGTSKIAARKVNTEVQNC